jgi:DNA polymerase III alpha subunit
MKIRAIAEFGEFRVGSNIFARGPLFPRRAFVGARKENAFAPSVEDRSSGVKCLVWADAYNKHSAHLVDDAMIIIVRKRWKMLSAQGMLAVIVNEVRPIEDQDCSGVPNTRLYQTSRGGG